MGSEQSATVYRKSATPGAPPSTAAQKRLEALRCCPLGRLVVQLQEIDDEIKEIKLSERPSRMVIATLMSVKFNVLKALLPYAYSTVPTTQLVDTNARMPVTIVLDTAEIMREEAELIEKIDEALDEVREQFPQYVAKT